jgi:hypothetical protein
VAEFHRSGGALRPFINLHLPYFQYVNHWHTTCFSYSRKEDKKMKTKLMALLLMAGSTMFAGVRFGVGIGVGVPVAPVVVAAAIPPCPGPGYVWTNGIWVAPAFVGVGPRFYGGRYYVGHPYARGYARGFRR